MANPFELKRSRIPTSGNHVPQIDAILWQGISLWKIPFHVFGSPQRRLLRIRHSDDSSSSKDLTTVLNNKKKEKRKLYYPVSIEIFEKEERKKKIILLDEIHSIRRGDCSDAFNAYRARNGPESLPRSDLCFSIATSTRTFDFYAESPTLSNLMLDGIIALMGSLSVTKTHQPDRRQFEVENLKKKQFFSSAKSGDAQKFRWYLEEGYAVNMEENDARRDTALIAACRLGKTEIVQIALDFDAKNDPHPSFGQTALQVAVSSGHASCVQMILETAALSEADHIIANHEDHAKEAPLHVASRCGNLEVLELLVRHGANVFSVDAKGRTSLHCAVQSGHHSCLRFLLQIGGQQLIEERDDRGYTSLHIAVKQNNFICTKELLDSGAQARALTLDGMDALQLATNQRSRKLIDLILHYYRSVGSPLSKQDGSDLFHGLEVFTTPRSVQSPQNKNHPDVPTHIQDDDIQSLSPISHHTGYQHDSQAESFYYGEHLWFTFLYNDNGCVHPYFLRAFDNHSQWEDPRYAGCIDFIPYNHSYVKGYTWNQGNAVPSVTQERQNVDNIRFSRHTEPDREQILDISCLLLHQNKNREKDENGNNCRVSQSNRACRRVNCSSNAIDRNSESGNGTILTQPPAPTGQRLKNGRTSREVFSPPFISQSNISNVQESRDLAIGVKDESPILYMEEQERQRSIIENHVGQYSKSSYYEDEQKSAIRDKKTASPSQEGHVPNQTSPDAVALKSAVNTLPRNGSIEIIQKREAMPMVPPSPLRHTVNAPSSNKDEYERYSKMLSIGVPLEAIVHKMRKDGVNDEAIATFQNKNKKTDNVEAGVGKGGNVTGGEADLSKYERMMNVGVPFESILHKMIKDGKSSNVIDSFKKDQGESISSNCETNQDVNHNLRNDASLKKYRTMISVGVPCDSVLHKMRKDGVDDVRMNSFLAENEMKPSREIGNVQSDAELQKEAKILIDNDCTLTKYKKMASVGVPAQSIANKMRQEGVDKRKIDAFELVNGLTPSPPTRSPLRQLNLPLPPPLTAQMSRRRTSVKMQKIHWKPISQEKAGNSLWASALDSESAIDDSEVKELENLFGAKKTIPTSSQKGDGGQKQVQQPKVSLIDTKRSYNIAISLAQFRGFNNYDDLCQAVVSLDSSELNGEQLQNMTTLMPTKDELKKMEAYTGNCDGLGRAEQFFLSISKVPRFTQKLNAFLFVLQFADTANDLQHMLIGLENACKDIVNNGKLTCILKRLLAIGNLVNEGAGKPKAVGITLDSLLKTANKTGTDGKTRVIDLVVANFLKQDDEGTSIEFWPELKSVNDASRVDIRDCKLSLQDIENGIKRIKLTIDTEVENAPSGINTNNTSSALFLERSRHFLSVASKICRNLEAKVGETEKSFETLCAFFAEDPGTCKATSVFEVILNFGRVVQKSKETWMRKSRAAKRRKVMNTPIKTTRLTLSKRQSRNNEKPQSPTPEPVFHSKNELPQPVKLRMMNRIIGPSDDNDDDEWDSDA